MSDILISTTNPQPVKSGGQSALDMFVANLPPESAEKSAPQKDDMDLSSFFLG